MKKSLILSLLAVLLYTAVISQGLTGINYQAVARNLNGTVLVNKAIQVRFTITLGNTTSVQYQETHNAITNNYGLFNLVIGKGTPLAGTFTGVLWAASNQWLQVEVATNGGPLVSLGKNPFYSVPYALMATQASPVGPAGGDLGGTYPNPILSTTSVIAGSYGSATTYPSFIVDTKGRLTNAGSFPVPTSLPPNGPAGGDLAGTFPNPLLSTTAVTAGSYGNATNYPTFTVDAKGRLTAAASVPFPAGLPPTGTAGGDLSGTYPNPLITIPFIKTSSQAANPLIGMTNSSTTGTLGAIQAASASQDGSASALQATITSTSPGAFSSAIRGINNGSGGLGIGVYGSQAGSGWGVYGVTPDGLGVYGNSTAGGYGIYGNSNTGIGVNGTSATGIAGNFSITNNANANAALMAATLGDGAAVDATSSSTTSSIAAIKGTISSTAPGGFSAAVRGINNGTGGLGIGVWGSQNGSGWGLYGITPTGIGVYGNSSSTGTGVYANSNTGTGLFATSTNGTAANFSISNNANANYVIDASTLGGGTVVNVTAGTGRGVYANAPSATAIEGVTGSISAAGVIGRNPTGEAIVGFSSGNSGVGAVVGRNDGAGYGVRGFNTLNGIGVIGQAGISGGTGIAGRFENVNASNNSNALEVNTNGTGNGANITLSNAGSGANGVNIAVSGSGRGVYASSTNGTAIEGITSTISAAGVIGRNTTGEAVVGFSSGVAGVGAVVGRSDGAGYGVRGFNTQNGIGVMGQAGISGGTGTAGRFENVNAANGTDVFIVSSNSTANLAVFQKGGNVARIDANGRGFFNGGTQTGGADVAEYFDVEGSRNSYEPGDVLVISQNSDRKVEKSSTPYSTLVSGVFATKPGLLLTEKNAANDNFDDMVPMGVIGVIPTKVCMEGGAIKRGDLLVTSSTSGVAMKADLDKVKVGQVIGKALQDYSSVAETGKINVLVSVK